MRDEDKTKEQLFAELLELRGRLADMEARQCRCRQTEEELLNALTLNQTILDTSPAAIIIYKASGPGVLANNAAARIVGGSREQLATQNFHSIASWKESGLYGAARDAVDIGKVAKIETHLVTTFGREIWIDATFSTFVSGDETYLALLFNDITYRKRVEESLAESKERFSQFMRFLPGPAFIKDDNLHHVFVNDYLETALGFPLGDINGKGSEDIWPAEIARHLKEHDELVMKKGVPIQFEEEIQQKGGRRTYLVSKFPINRPGKAPLLGGIGVDITDRKLIEDFQVFLAKSGGSTPGEDFFQSLARFLAEKLETDFVCIDRLKKGNLEATTVAVYFDGKFEDNITYTLKDTPCGDVVEQAACCFRSGVCQLFPKDQVLQDMKAESYAGTILWDHSGQPIGLIALIWRRPLENPELVKSILQLVGTRAAGELERKQAEAQLNKLSTAIEQSPASIVITDMDGNIEYVNPKFTKLTGYTLEEAVGQNPRILKSGVQGPEVYEQLWKTIASGDVWRGEFCNKKKNGELYWESAVISPVKDANGLITHFLAVKEDITELKKVEEEKKRLEAQLRQAQKLETIGTLAGGIAHDFNNILQPVSSCTDMLRSHLPADSPLRKYVDLMSRAVERGSGLVRQLLTFSRQREHERRPLRLKPVIEETLNLLRAVMPSTVDVQTQITPAGGLVLADPVQVQQVVMNLCTNACDAMDRNGKLTVRLEEVDVDKVAAKGGLRLRPGRYARIAVHDTGHGMDDETQKRIFDPFFTTKEVGKGTGLGLSVVHGIVLEHDGEVVVESEPAKGTTFMVYLPLIDAAVEEKSEHHAEEADKGKGNVLFVDDNEDIVILAEEMMEHLGYTVTATTRQAEALDIFRRDPRGFDLIISDYSMPGITGIQFAWEILNIRPDIPILLITGNNEAIPPAKLKEIPIRGVLSKPFKMDKISETIRRVLEGQAD